MPTTLPANFFAIPSDARPRPSPFTGACAEIMLIAAWAFVMLAASLVALRHGVTFEAGAILP